MGNAPASQVEPNMEPHESATIDIEEKNSLKKPCVILFGVVWCLKYDVERW